jgi:integrase
VLVAFKRHAEEYHRTADGQLAREYENYIISMRPLKKLYSGLSVLEFGPVQMKAVRREMIDMGWARTHINRQLGRLRHIFNWAASEAIIPAAIADAVAKVKGLRFGKTEARESEPVEPVADEHFRATLPFLPPMIKSMVELQLLTGMRPGEICSMRNRDIDAPAGKLWHYRPARHKTSHRGIKRSIPLGPKARDIIAPYMGLDPEAFIFRPSKSEADRRERQREARKTPVQPSQIQRAAHARRRRSKRAPGDFYDVHAYRRAVARACDAAFPPPDHLARLRGERRDVWHKRLSDKHRAELLAWQAEHRWHPHQLRHNAATLIRELYGIEAAQALLGHKSLAMTEVYAQRNLKAAERVMNEVG